MIFTVKIRIIYIFLQFIFVVLDEEKRNRFKINVYTEGYLENEDGLSCDIVVQFNPKYPDEPPIIEIESETNFEDYTKEKLKEAIDSCIEENLGTEMIFSIVGCAQELMNTIFDQIKIDREEAREKKQKEIEEIEMKKFEGTRVTGRSIYPSISKVQSIYCMLFF